MSSQHIKRLPPVRKTHFGYSLKGIAYYLSDHRIRIGIQYGRDQELRIVFVQLIKVAYGLQIGRSLAVVKKIQHIHFPLPFLVTARLRCKLKGCTWFKTRYFRSPYRGMKMSGHIIQLQDSKEQWKKTFFVRYLITRFGKLLLVGIQTI